jgi:hypothetical protein
LELLAVLKDDRPYELKYTEGKLVGRDEAKRQMLTKYRGLEDRQQERHRRNNMISKSRETTTNRTNEAVKAPQPV